MAKKKGIIRQRKSTMDRRLGSIMGEIRSGRKKKPTKKKSTYK